MSEVKPTETTLPFPFLSPDHSAHRSFAFGNQFNEQSFEHFDFPINSDPVEIHISPLQTVSLTEQDLQLPTEDRITAKTIKVKRQTETRNYKLYAGNTYFFCGGRFLTGKALGAFCLSLLILCGPCILFLIFTCPWLWYHISPAVPIVYAYMFLVTLSSMFKTSWTDPGILPRNLDGVSPMNTNRQDEFGFRYSEMSDYNAPLPKEVMIKGELVRLKYCETCCIYRPPRSSHCKQCDNCVENEDHHCIWLNNCIGKRNYTTFFTFILGSTFCCCYIVAFSLSHVIIVCLETTEKSFVKALAKTPISFAVSLVCLLLLFPICGLTNYHCFLITKGVTTHEQLRSGIPSPFDHHPFDSGNSFKNIFYVLCRPHNKSYIGRRKFAEEIHEVQPPSDNVLSSISSTAHDDFAQHLTVDPVTASNVPLQKK